MCANHKEIIIYPGVRHTTEVIFRIFPYFNFLADLSICIRAEHLNGILAHNTRIAAEELAHPV